MYETNDKLKNSATQTELSKRLTAMRNEYFNGWQSSHQDLRTYIDQKRGVFDDNTSQRGQMINHQFLLDDHACKANDDMASLLHSGMTPQYRPWFDLTLDDISLNKIPGVRAALDETKKVFNWVLNKSNIYSTLISTYAELGQFGTGCFLIVPDFEDVIRCRGFTAGEYYLGIDARGRVNSFARYFWMNVGQLIKEFGYESCSPQVQNLWKTNYPDSWHKVSHLIEPNETRIPMMDDFGNMPYRSAYWEYGAGYDKFLAVRGFKNFPVIAPRWKTVTTDQIYGYGPGWYVLGNSKQLQKTVLDRIMSQEKFHNPPMQQHGGVEGHSNLLPGGLTKFSDSLPDAGLKPAYQIDLKLESFLEAERDLTQKIDTRFFINVLSVFLNMVDEKKTATEINAMMSEKIAATGPILYRIQEELLDPMMELIFSYIEEANLLPQFPREVQGQAIKIKYVSALAQAQQAFGVEQINRVIGFVGQVVQIAPQTVDLVNWDEALRQISELEGAPAKLLYDEQTVEGIREGKAQQEQMVKMQQAAGMAESASKTTKNLANSPMGENSALDGLMKGVPK